MTGSSRVHLRARPLAWIAALCLSIAGPAACGESGQTPSTPPSGAQRLEVAVSTTRLVVGGRLQIQVFRVDGTGRVDVTRSASWVSSDAAVATVSAAGAIEALKEGATTITARVAGLTVNSDIEVTDEFTVVLIPDTQYEAEESNGANVGMLFAQMNWIAENIKQENIRAVAGLGDIVNLPYERGQWVNADSAYRVLDETNLPYLPTIGNHDYDGIRARRTGEYNRWFGWKRFQRHAWAQQSSYPAGQRENSFIRFTAGGREYLVLALELYPRDAALAWAQTVIDAHPDAQIIVVTHAFLYMDGRRSTDDVTTGPIVIGLPADESNNAEEVWDKLIRTNPRIIAVASGHWTVARRQDSNDAGLLVPQMMSDYQRDGRGGSGFLRLLRFSASRGQISVQTYSPYYKEYRRDADHEFVTPYAVPPVFHGR
jgi:hypothetical protein